ncbi:MAG: hypothetical protein JNL97_11085 [Verrucomicrobiales bacterium]|nr:hypothetical protein [Verrucomicrobiales bacterium]
MNPDILIRALPVPKAAAGEPAPAASPDFKDKDRAKDGCYDGTCGCASDGTRGGNGNHGNRGQPGLTGNPAPTFALIVGRLLSDLVVTSQGGRGGEGGDGTDGTDGGDGQDAGRNNASCVSALEGEEPHCRLATGGSGGDAGGGGDGGPGGNGGAGGSIHISYRQPQGDSTTGAVYQVHAASYGGDVGPGGRPGKAGKPGIGGLNEEPPPSTEENSPATRVPPRQESGAPATDGSPGPNGKLPGRVGQIQVHVVQPTGSSV